MRIVIRKTARMLECFERGIPVLTAPVQLGFGANAGAKEREGDGRTPEGVYSICSRNPESRFHLSLGVSYPNPDDANRALASGILTAAEHARIVRSPERPPWDTPLGGFIMIHGQPNDGPRTGDWTAGCIALSNADMDGLWTLAKIGDEVVIHP